MEATARKGRFRICRRKDDLGWRFSWAVFLSLTNPAFAFILVVVLGVSAFPIFGYLSEERWVEEVLGEIDAGKKGDSLEAGFSCQGLFMRFTGDFPRWKRNASKESILQDSGFSLLFVVRDEETGDSLLRRKIEVNYSEWVDRGTNIPSLVLDTGKGCPLASGRRYLVSATVVHPDPRFGRMKVVAHCVD